MSVTRGQVDGITEEIIGAAIEVHRQLGPGLLESAYHNCLCHELTLRRIPHDKELTLPILYKGIEVDTGYRLDILVRGIVVVELKAVEKTLPSTTHKFLPISGSGITPLGFCSISTSLN